MNIRAKIKSAWNKVTGKSARSKNMTDSELGADEVVQEEVFPKKVQTRKKCTNKKPPSKRTRPTNNDYQMIDPENDTCDCGKS